MRTGRAIDDLVHPHQETVSSHDADGDDRPNAECEDCESKEFAAAPGAEPTDVFRSNIGHFWHLLTYIKIAIDDPLVQLVSTCFAGKLRICVTLMGLRPINFGRQAR
jgi:hypothetical protein